MNFVTFKYTGSEAIPAEVTLGEHTTPVWIQQKWEEGQYAEYVRKNGCGHCCTAMVLNLHGVKIDPHEEFTTCRKLWGEPRKDEPYCEDNFISAAGSVKILRHFGVEAACFGVPAGECDKAAEHIVQSLGEGRQVIIWSHPSPKLPNNPYSPGEHYILAAGMTEDGRILIANSSSRAAVNDGIQYIDKETISKILYEGCTPADRTWGCYPLNISGGYIVAG